MPSNNILARRWKAWGSDAAERAVKTFAQAVLATGLITEGVDLDAVLTSEPWSVGIAAAIISVLTSLASKRTGAPDTASAND
jgi:hypothetical protein